MNGASLARAAALAAAVLALSACATLKLPPPAGGADAVLSLRAANAAAARTGTFTLAPGLPASADGSVGGLRGSSVQAPDGSFSHYLRDVIASDLKAAGLLDEKSDIVISGELTESQVDAAIGTGTAHLGAHLVVTRGGAKVYERTLAVNDSWASSFMGAIAIPEAMNRYTALYQKLAGQLFADPDFRRAVAR